MRNKPNVIFIYADDMGRGLLSCYGQKYFRTPNIDRLCMEGLNFINAHGCHLCAPARASLICGVHDAHLGKWQYTRANDVYKEYARGNMELEDIYEMILNTGVIDRCGDRFLPMVFRDAGYVTGQIGKLDWGFATAGREVESHGWDYHYGYYDHVMCHGYYPPFMFENGRCVEIPGNTDPDCGAAQYCVENGCKNGEDTEMGRAVYSQDLFDKKIHDFLCAHRDEPFFLYHPTQLPHAKLSIPEIHSSVKENPHLNFSEKLYASMVIRLDDTVGKILEELDTLGIADNTMVVFGADNGHCPYYTTERTGLPMYGDLQTGKRFDSLTARFTSERGGDIFDGNNGMTGTKTTNFEGGTCVPLMFYWPGHIQPGTSDRLIANYDFMTTMADMVGTDPGRDKDGTSYLGTLLDSWEHDREHDYIVYASSRGPALLTKDGWKLRSYLTDRYKPGMFGATWDEIPGQVVFELYHIPEDYKEENNLAEKYPERAKEMQKLLLRACDGNLINGVPQTHFAYYGYDFKTENLSRKRRENNI